MRWIILILMLLVGCADSPLDTIEVRENMQVTSPDFEEAGIIPAKFTADGDNINPNLIIEGVPENAQSLVLIVDDPDAPSGVWTHWVVFDIDASVSEISADSVPGKQALNDFNKAEYGGPSPPSGTHRYYFKVFALDAKLNLAEGVSHLGVEKAMENHILAQGQLMGKYSR